MSAPTGSSPKPSRLNQFRSAVRRSSSLLSVGRTKTPANDAESDTASIKSAKSGAPSTSGNGTGTGNGGGASGGAGKRSQKIDTSGSTTGRARGASVSSSSSSVKGGVAGGGGGASSMPTPIAESPMREMEAMAAEQYQPLGASPLTQPPQPQTRPHTPTPETQVERQQGQQVAATGALKKADSDAGSVPEAMSSPEGTSPVGYVPPPLLDSSEGNPGAFTDDPDSLPQPTIIRDPYAESTTLLALDRSRSQLNLSSSSNTGAAGIEAQRSVGNESVVTSTDEGSGGHGGRFFGGPMVESMAGSEEDLGRAQHRDDDDDDESSRHRAFAAAVEDNVGLNPAGSAPQSAVSEAQGYAFSKKGAAEAERERERAREVEQRESSLPAYEAMATQNVWAAPVATVGSTSAAPAVTSRAPPSDDPFLDPTTSRAPPMPQPQLAPAPVPQVMPAERHDSFPAVLPLPPFHTLPAPQPLRQAPSDSEYGRERGYDVDSETRPLLGNGTARQYGSGTGSGVQPQNSNSNNGSSSGFDAWVPQAAAMGVAAGAVGGGAAAYGAGRAGSTGNGSPVVYRPANTTGSGGIGAMMPPPRLHDLGWLEYHLPDGSFYYVHPTRKVTTDVNLRDEKVLSEVTVYLEDGDTNPTNYDSFFNHDSSVQPVVHGHGAASSAKGTPPPGVEIWLRDASTPKTRRKRGAPAFIPIKCFVDHHTRSVIVDTTAPQGQGKGKGKLVKSFASSRKKSGPEEDQLDMEFRYWSFMEAHPSHAPLPVKARSEVNEVLNWAWTDRLLPSHRAIPAPFTHEECQELRKMLDTISNDSHSDEYGIQVRVVARILLRVALWRQTYFRPNKPLPNDVKSNQFHVPGTSATRRSFPRAILDFCIGFICLGIPYLFLERARSFGAGGGRIMDDESTGGGLLRSAGGAGAGPVFVVGACACLVAAIVLSASVTFLSLPGLDGFTRIAGLGAVLFASLSMASTLLAFFRVKYDMDRATAATAGTLGAGTAVGLEGLVTISKRAVILSLPLVFLAYSIIAFIVGITLYSFRGGSLSDLSQAWASLWAPYDSRPTTAAAPFTAPSSAAAEETSVYTLPPGVAPAETTGHYARWSFIGLAGVAAGVVTVAWVAAKRNE